MALVMLKGNWPGNFSRTVRNKKGEVLRRLTFMPGVVHDLKGLDLQAVEADIGPALLAVTIREDGKPIPVDVTSDDVSRAVAAEAKPNPTGSGSKDSAASDEAPSDLEPGQLRN